jgi:hypothetical protein
VGVPDKAMFRDGYPSYAPGAIAFVNPDVTEYQTENIVHAVIASRNDTVIQEYRRQLGSDGNVKVILRAFGPAFGDIEFRPDDGDFIVGRIVGSLNL